MSSGDRVYGSYFPVAVRMDGRKAVIIGGDAEAEIRVRKLLAAGAAVTVVAPEVTEGIAREAGEGRVEIRRRRYREGDLAGASIAIVCDTSVAEDARAEAGRRNVLLNVLDRPDLCDFIAVAYFVRDGLQVSVHSSGKSAALSRRLRERLEAQIHEGYGALVAALGRIRPLVERAIPSPDARRRFWLESVDEELLRRVDARDFDPADLESRLLARAAAGG